jgi:hypothetical protein
MIFQRIKSSFKPGDPIPGTPYTVKAFKKRNGEPALVYRIPNRGGGKPYEKRIPERECELAHSELVNSGEFTRAWFIHNMPCSKDGGCSFRVVGEVFVFLGEAATEGRGKYIQLPHSATEK